MNQNPGDRLVRIDEWDTEWVSNHSEGLEALVLVVNLADGASRPEHRGG